MNEIILYEDYAEVILCDKHGQERCRALIDLDDVERVRVCRWCFDGKYVRKSDKQRLHRFIMDCPDNMIVDHINMNRLDNRKSNLRICTKSQNNMNKRKQSNNTSGITGVVWDKQNNKWIAQININSRNIKLGRFSTIEEAIEARKQAELEYFGEYRNQEDEE